MRLIVFKHKKKIYLLNSQQKVLKTKLKGTTLAFLRWLIISKLIVFVLSLFWKKKNKKRGLSRNRKQITNDMSQIF